MFLLLSVHQSVTRIVHLLLSIELFYIYGTAVNDAIKTFKNWTPTA